MFVSMSMIPFSALAAEPPPLVPNCGANCGFPELLLLGKNIINYLILFSIPLAAIALAWAGFLYLSSAGSQSKMDDAKKIFTKVSIGFLFILTAWLIVHTIVGLLNPSFSLLK